MLTGGFKTLQQAVDAVSDGGVDVVGLARALALDPVLPINWQAGEACDPVFPRFTAPPEGGIAAWYTMRLTELGEDRETSGIPDLETAIRQYDSRDKNRAALWNNHFSS